MTRAHGCKEQQSGVTTQISRAPPARATNPRTGGHRPKERPPFVGTPSVVYFLTWTPTVRAPRSLVRRDFYFAVSEVSWLTSPMACRRAVRLDGSSRGCVHGFSLLVFTVLQTGVNSVFVYLSLAFFAIGLTVFLGYSHLFRRTYLLLRAGCACAFINFLTADRGVYFCTRFLHQTCIPGCQRCHIRLNAPTQGT